MLDANIASDAVNNMKQFMDAAKFKKATLTYFASKLPEKNIEDLRSSFISMDLNGDGFL